MFDHTFDHRLLSFIRLILFQQLYEQGVYADGHLLVLALQSVAIGAEGVHRPAMPHQRLDLPLGEILHHGDKGVAQLVGGHIRDPVGFAVPLPITAIGVRTGDPEDGAVSRQAVLTQA